MANSIIGNGASSQPSQPFNQNMIQQFMQFKNSFTGNPKQMVMNMLANGQISNPQLQQVMQLAKQFQSFLK